MPLPIVKSACSFAEPVDPKVCEVSLYSPTTNDPSVFATVPSPVAKEYSPKAMVFCPPANELKPDALVSIPVAKEAMPIFCGAHALEPI